MRFLNIDTLFIYVLDSRGFRLIFGENNSYAKNLFTVASRCILHQYPGPRAEIGKGTEISTNLHREDELKPANDGTISRVQQ